MTLIKTSLLNGVAVVVRILTSLVLNKVLAVHVGVAGYAVIGQFQNFVAVLTSLASGAVNTGVTKYTAEYFDDEERQIAIWKTAGAIALIGSIALGIVIVSLRNRLASWVLGDESFATVFLALGISLVLFTFNGLLLAILNGKKEINRYVAVNISGSLLGLVVTGGLAAQWGLFGALVALAINQSIVFVVTLAMCSRAPWFRLPNLKSSFDTSALRDLGKFALMAVTSAACIPVSQILIRNHLGESFGWEAAGLWEALTRISGLYLMLVTTPLAVYYLPRLAEIRSKTELKEEIFQGYRIILPVAAAGALTIYILRDWIIATLFTAEFTPMRELFAWQLAGDVLKIGSWLLAHLMLAKALTRTFIITEIAFSVSFVALATCLTNSFGLQGVMLAYAINYIFYWIAMMAIVNRQIFLTTEK